MSNFWGTVLGAPPAPQQAPVPVQQNPFTSRNPFFAPDPFQVVPTVAPAVPTQQVYGQPQPQGEVNVYNGTEQGAAAKAISAKQTETCPECGSGDYFQPQGQPNAMKQCYSCGYNPRFAHSTAGAGMPGGEASGAATPSRQTRVGGRGGVSQYHGHTIVGNVGNVG